MLFYFSLELRDVFALLEISGPITSLPLCVFEAVPIENCKSNVSGFFALDLSSRPCALVPPNLASGRQSLLSKKQRKELTPFFFGLQLRNNTPRRIGRLYAGNQRSFSGHVSKEASRWNFQKKALTGYLICSNRLSFHCPNTMCRPLTCLWRLKGAPTQPSRSLPDIQELAGELGFKVRNIVAKRVRLMLATSGFSKQRQRALLWNKIVGGS